MNLAFQINLRKINLALQIGVGATWCIANPNLAALAWTAGEIGFAYLTKASLADSNWVVLTSKVVFQIGQRAKLGIITELLRELLFADILE